MSARNDREDRADNSADADQHLFEELLVVLDETLATGSPGTVVDRLPAASHAREELLEFEDVLAELHDAARRGELDRWRDVSTNDLVAVDRSAPALDLAAGERIGRFVLIAELGRGGYGVVFLAHDPSLNRDVALKLPRPEVLVTPDLRRRFLREAQAAARLEHPNLVPVHEIGEDGAVCYLVSQFCHGPTLAEWLRSQERSVPAGDAALMVTALADALEHAHREGVLHRDIKPANVLLDPMVVGDAFSQPHDARPLSDFIPKLNDFGLAKLVETQEQETRSGAMLGTPTYMSPEQAQGHSREIGPAADIYALGVLLYETLIGRPPFVGQSDAETLQLVIHDEPVHPSRLRAGLPLDLEAICLKCLEKNPAQRYASASALADDLRRFLLNRPTSARPLTAWRRVRKWSARNPGVAGLTAAVTLLLATLAIGSAAAAIAMARLAERERVAAREAQLAEHIAEEAQRDAESQRDQKEIERQRASEAQRQAQAELESRQTVSQFLADLLKTPDTSGMSGFGLRQQGDGALELTARQILDRGEERLAHELKDQPLVRAQLLSTIGNVYTNLGEIPKAGRLLDEALALQRANEAPPLELAETLHNLAWVRHLEGHFREGEAAGREALAIRREILGEHDLLVAATMFNLAWCVSDSDRLHPPPEVEDLFTRALEIRRRHLPWSHRDLGISLSALAAVRLQQKNQPAAMSLLTQAAFVFVQQPGGDKLGKALGAFQRAVIFRNRHLYGRAEENYREALWLLHEFFAADHPSMALILGDMAGMLKQARQFDRAEAAAREAIALGKKFAPGGHPQLIVALDELAEAVSDRGDHEEAIALLREATELGHSLYGPDAIQNAPAWSRLAYGLRIQGDYAGAFAALSNTMRLIELDHGPGEDDYKECECEWAAMLSECGEPERAAGLFRRVISEHYVKGYPHALDRAHYELSVALNRIEPGSREAEYFADRSIVRRDNSALTADRLGNWAQILIDRGDATTVLPTVQDALRILEEQLATWHWSIQQARFRLGECLAAQRNYTEAVSLLVEACRGLERTRGPHHLRTTEARLRLAKIVASDPDAAELAPVRELLAERPGL